MTIQLSVSHQSTLERAAALAYPEECCGLILGRRVMGAGGEDRQEQYREVVDVVSLENIWEPAVQSYTDPDEVGEQNPNPNLRYWIDPAQMLAVQRSARDRGLEILGIYHSHPDHPAVPSECDRRLAWPVYSYIILSVQRGQTVDLQSWRLGDDEQFHPEPVKIIDSSANKAPFMA